MSMFAPTIRRIKLIDEITLVNLIGAISLITNILNVESIDLIDLITTISTITNIVNVESIDLIDLITKIAEITTIKNIETIGDMPDITMKGSEGVAIRQREPGSGVWIDPDGYVASVWSDEALAYDNNFGTQAHYVTDPRTWSPFLILTHSAIRTSKIRFLAQRSTGLTEIDLDVFKDGVWTHVYEGEFEQIAYEEKIFAEGLVTQVRMRFYNSHPTLTRVSAVKEVDFWEVSATGGELLTILYAWDGSAYQRVRCDGDGYLLTKAG